LGEHLADELEPKDQILRPGARAMEGTERDGADHPPPTRSGIARLDLSPVRSQYSRSTAASGGKSAGMSVSTTIRPARSSRNTRAAAGAGPGAIGLDPRSGSPSRGSGRLGVGDLREAAAVEAEEVRQALQGAPELIDHLIGRQVREAGRQIAQQALEGQALGERDQ
jgi:hypothetical protein